MTDKKYSIGITTFSNRLDHVVKLTNQIRLYTDADILISVNGNYNEDFNNDYREDVLRLCLKHKNTYPIFFPEQRGLSKLWNTLIIHSKTDWVLILNDDLEITSEAFFTTLEQNLINQHDDICRINGTFSHFAINKNIIIDLGWFDERLLGFGEEDGDIIYRYVEKYNKNVTEWSIGNIISIGSWIRDENIRPGVSKYSAFNREFMFGSDASKYIPSNTDEGIEGMFGSKHIQNNSNDCQYPYEPFFKLNKNKL
jgi:glycosyltransferase involved in cell wall biosynthesis